jgi:hypothetical protein
MVQGRAGRFITNRQRNTSSIGEMLQHLIWCSIEDRLKDSQLVMMYKIANENIVTERRQQPWISLSKLWAAGSSQISYNREETAALFLLSLIKRDNERPGVHVPWLSQWWLVLFSNNYIFVCYFIHHDKLRIFKPVFNTASDQVL